MFTLFYFGQIILFGQIFERAFYQKKYFSKFKCYQTLSLSFRLRWNLIDREATEFQSLSFLFDPAHFLSMLMGHFILCVIFAVLISVSNLLWNHQLFHVKCRDLHIYRSTLWTWRTQTNPTSKKCLGLGGQIEWWPDSVWFLIIYVCVCVIFKWLFKFSYVTQWSAPDNPYLIRLSIKNSQKKAAWIQLVWTKFFPKLDPAQLSQS